MASAIVALDESTSGNIVTAGGLYLTTGNISFVKLGIDRAKSAYNIPINAKIHCRELFAGDKRRKTAFRTLGPSDLVPFLSRVISEVGISGAFWLGAHCNMQGYPKTLKMSFDANSRYFDVTYKHVAGFMLSVCVVVLENNAKTDFDVLFDKDATKIDWGLASRMQATHFVSTLQNAIQPSPNNVYLLELADVSAYVLGRAIAAKGEPDNRKIQRFVPLLQQMNMLVTEFFWPAAAPNPADF